MAVNLDLTWMLIVSGIMTVALLLVAYAIAGYYERRARRRREARSAR